jgi:hypothetical protein
MSPRWDRVVFINVNLITVRLMHRQAASFGCTVFKPLRLVVRAY